MAIIKPLLREELANSIKLKALYERELKKLPRGAVIKKRIKNGEYYYLVVRECGKVKYTYLGKVNKEELEKRKMIKLKRRQLRNKLSKVKKQIKYLKGVLRGKESI